MNTAAENNENDGGGSHRNRAEEEAFVTSINEYGSPDQLKKGEDDCSPQKLSEQTKYKSSLKKNPRYPVPK